MIYLASPYTSADPEEVELRYDQALECFATLCQMGEIVYSPIVHCHPTAQRYSLPQDYAYWAKLNFTFLTRCDTLYVLCLPGWSHSLGVQEEIKLAKQFHLPIYYIDIDGTRCDVDGLLV